MPHPAETAASGPDADSTTTTPPPPKPSGGDAAQLELRFFEVVGAYRGTAPERALWRIQLDLAVPRIATAAFRATAVAVAGRPISPAAVVCVAWAIYSLANAAGLTRVPHHEIAHHARLDEKTARAAIELLEYWRVIRRDRPKRRTAEIITMNLGGLSWEMVRHRLRAARRNGSTKSEPRLFRAPLPEPPSPGIVPGLKSPSPGTMPGPRAVRTEGLYTTTTAREGWSATQPVTRPEPTAKQLEYAADLGIETDGVDGVELGERIEHAVAARDAGRSERRDARRSERRSDRPRRTAVEARRLAEAAARPSPGRVRNCPHCRTLDRGADCHCESCGWSEPGCPHTTSS